MTVMRILFFGLLFFWVSGCTIEEAQAPTSNELVISSDYLTEGDSLLFSDFCKENNVQIRIIPLAAENLVQRLDERQANSGIDVVMLRSMYHVNQLTRKQLLQSINLEETLDKAEAKHASWKYNYVGFGIDPFGIAYLDTIPNSIQTYNDLTRFNFLNSLNKAEQVTMLAPSLEKMQKVHAQNWIKDFVEHGKSVRNSPDTLRSHLPVFTSYSHYLSQKDSLQYFRGKKQLFLNRNSTGSFYDLRTICISRQAEHYTSAIKLVKHFVKEKENRRLTKALHILSIHESSGNFRSYSTPMEELISYFSMVERVLDKVHVD